MKAKLLQTSPQALRITQGYYKLWFSIYGATNSHPYGTRLVFSFRKKKTKNSSLSVNKPVDTQYNCHRCVCQSAEKLLSTDPHPSAAVLLHVDISVDVLLTSCRRIRRHTVGICSFLGSPPLAKPSVVRHLLLQYMARSTCLPE